MAAARKLGFCEGGSDGCRFRVPGGCGVAFIGVDVPLTCRPRRGRGGTGSGRTRRSPSWARRGEDGGSDRQGPRVGERRGKEGAERAGPRGEKKGRKEKGEMGRAENGIGKKERLSIFLKQFEHLQFKFKSEDSNLS